MQISFCLMIQFKFLLQSFISELAFSFVDIICKCNFAFLILEKFRKERESFSFLNLKLKLLNLTVKTQNILFFGKKLKNIMNSLKLYYQNMYWTWFRIKWNIWVIINIRSFILTWFKIVGYIHAYLAFVYSTIVIANILY